MPRASSRSSSSARVELLLGAAEQLLGRVGVLAQLALGQAHGQRERDEPLLGAVVQVALEPAALGGPGLDDPGARGAQLLDPGAQLGLQALVLDREARGGRDRADELRVVAERAVVHDRADARGPRARRA